MKAKWYEITIAWLIIVTLILSMILIVSCVTAKKPKKFRNACGIEMVG